MMLEGEEKEKSLLPVSDRSATLCHLTLYKCPPSIPLHQEIIDAITGTQQMKKERLKELSHMRSRSP